MGRQGSTNAIARRSRFPRLFQHQAGHLLRLLLFEEGLLGLDDPIEKFIPQLADRKVLRPGAVSLHETEPARGSITIRHLLSHSSGLSYGVFDPGTAIFKAYNERRILNPATPLADMIDQLADLPLLYHPGTSWEYSVATDVIARLVEIISAQPFDHFIQARILGPPGMVDTGFVVPEKDNGRFASYYNGADLMDPLKPGLTRNDNAPYPGAYLRPVPRFNGGGGLVSTLPDMVALIRSLLPGGPRPNPAQAQDDCVDDDQPVGRRRLDALSHDRRASRQGIRADRRADPQALAVRPSGLGRRALLGRRGGHAMVDFTTKECCGLDDDATTHVVHASLCLRVQKAGVRSGKARALRKRAQAACATTRLRPSCLAR